MKLQEATVAFLDLQTTGSNPACGNLLEIGWCKGAALFPQPECLHSFLIAQPDELPVPARISALTGVSDAEMASAVPVAFAERLLLADLNSNQPATAAVIHYAKFEKPFLAVCLPNTMLQLRIYCTHEIAKRLLPNLPSRGIRALSGYFGLPVGACKRASSHVQATFLIWRHLCLKLADAGIQTFDELDAWLEATCPAQRTKYEYPLPESIRLSLPESPGIYRMIARTGDVLYVGKATNLHARVNSYFRGRRGRDSRKLEMLTQTWTIDYTICDTALQAAVLEVSEIHRLSPPYNISLRQGNRPLVFYQDNFKSSSPEPIGAAAIGPFRSASMIEPFIFLLQSLETGKFLPHMFYDQLSQELLAGGFQVLCRWHHLEGKHLANWRSLLALGLSLCRLTRGPTDQQDGSTPDDPPEDLQTDTALTFEDVAAKYQRLLMRAAAAYRLAKRLTRLFNACIIIQDSNRLQQVQVLDGEIVFDNFSQEKPTAIGANADWCGKNVHTFDKLRVLDTELGRIKSEGKKVAILATAKGSTAAVR